MTSLLAVSEARRAAVVYDCLFPLTHGGGERVYRRIAELLVGHGVATDYVTRRLWDGLPPVAAFQPIGIWSGELYGDNGLRRTSAAVTFAARCFGYFLRRRRNYDIVIASALPVLTAIAVRLALVGTSTRVVADWLEVWPAPKWREYAGVISGTFAVVVQWLGIHLIREHTANSAFTAARLRHLRPSAAVKVLGLVDLANEQPSASASSPPEVLFIGRLIEDKRPELVAAVVERARRFVPGLRGVIIGDGPRRELVELAIADRSMSGDVAVLGRVNEDELARWRGRAAVLLAPSVREGFGLAVAESAAAGVPVVVVRHRDNAAVDLVVPGINGEIAEPDDVDSLAAAVIRVIEAGPRMRATTLDWFREARLSRGLSASVEALLAARD